MNGRFSFSARGRLLLAATSLLLIVPVALTAQQKPDGEASRNLPATKTSPQPATKSAVERELEALYARDGKQPPRMTQAAAVEEVKKGGRNQPQAPAASTGWRSKLPWLSKAIPAKRPSSPQTASRPQPPTGHATAQQPSRMPPTSRPFAASAPTRNRGIQSHFAETPSHRTAAGEQPAGRQPSAIQQASAEVPAKGNAAQPQPKSKVLQELEELYRRDGKQMPPMSAAALPKTPEAAKVANQQRDLQKKEGAAQPGLLERVFGGRKETAQTQPAVRPRSTLPATPSRAVVQPGTPVPQPAASTPAKPSNRPGLLPDFLFPKQSPQDATAKPMPPQTAQQPAPQPAPPPTTAAKPLPTLPIQPPTPAVSKPRVVAPANPVAHSPATKSVVKTADATPDDDPFNPFAAGTERQPEQQANEKVAGTPRAPSATKAEIKPEMQVEENPFTGRTLDSHEVAPTVTKQVPAAADQAPAAANQAPTVANQAPAAAAKPIVEPKRLNPPANAGRNLPVIHHRPADTDDEGDKLRKIAQRDAQTGLKGFCPVVLRDQRALVDARPEFSATYDGVAFQFSDAAAQAKFLQSPEKYAPAVGGNDVILLENTNEEVPGSLDHAVWFKDRLYLFSSRESLQAFVLSPVKYAQGDE